MMLRESSRHTNEAVNLGDLTAGLSTDTKVENAPLLVEFAESVVARDDARIARAREAVLAAMGPTAFVDVAAVTAAFHGFVRIADAIGIPYKTAAGGGDVPEVREAAGVNRFPRVAADP